MAEQTTEYHEFVKIQKALSYHYEIKSRLGKGVYGQVYDAKSKNDGNTYAIKVMPFGDKKKEKYQRRELELLVRLTLLESSNVIKYFKSWMIQVSDGERLCIQMELCSVDLGEFVSKNKIAGSEIIKAHGPPRFYQHVFQQILNGLAFIHSIGWVHRDIHPGNILVVKPNPKQINDIHIKISDFGLARYIGIEFEKLPDGSIKELQENLTPLTCDIPIAYTAPEMKEPKANNKPPKPQSSDSQFPPPLLPYDFKVDVYSAGVVLYFISCHPVRDLSTLNSQVKAITGDQRSVKEFIYHKDDEKLSTLIRSLLQENPDARPDIHHAKEFMFPTEAPPIAEFFARKDDESDLNRCRLNEFTLSSMKKAVELKVEVKTDLQNLKEERMVNGERKRLKIKDDDDVKDMFQSAASTKRDVEVVVCVKPHEDSNMETGQTPPEN